MHILFIYLNFFKRFIYLMWTTFKVFIEFVTILPLFLCFGVWFFFWPWGMWDLSSPTRDWTCTLRIGRWTINLWTAKEVPVMHILYVINHSLLFLHSYPCHKGYKRIVFHLLFKAREKIMILKIAFIISLRWKEQMGELCEMGFSVLGIEGQCNYWCKILVFP